MSELLGDLVVRIGGDSENLQSSLRKAKDSLAEFGAQARSRASDIAMVGTAAAAAGVAIAAGLVANSIQGARELANLAKVANASAAEFQKTAFGARSVGIENEKFADILKDVNDKVGEFVQTGAGPMKDFFEQIAPKVGVTAEQFRTLSGPQALQLYVDSLEKANLSQQQMTFYMEALASDSTALIPLLQNGGAAMAEQAAQAERLGIVLSNIEVEQMRQAGIVFDQLGDVVTGLVDQFSAELAPSISAIGQMFLQTAGDAGGVGSAAKGAADIVIDVAGFMMDAIEGVRRTFELTGHGAALLGLGVQAMANKFVADIVNGPVYAVNALIEQLNRIPGVDIVPVSLTQFGQAANKAAGDSVAAMAEARLGIEEIMMRPMPSEAFGQFIADARTAAAETAAARIQIEELTRSRGTEGPLAGAALSDPKSAVATENSDLAQRLEAVRLANASELQLMVEKQAAEDETLRQALENQLITREQYALMQAEADARHAEVRGSILGAEAEEEARHHAEMAAMEQRAADERLKITEAEAAAKKAALGTALGDLSTLMNSGSRKMFEVGKAAAISQTVLSTYEGAQKAYSSLAGIPVVGPALGIAAAGAAIAAGVARVQSIRSQQFGAGASTPTGSNTGQINAGGQPVSASSGGGGSSGSGQTLYIQGINKNDLYSGNQLAELFNEMQRNGARFVLL